MSLWPFGLALAVSATASPVPRPLPSLPLTVERVERDPDVVAYDAFVLALSDSIGLAEDPIWPFLASLDAQSSVTPAERVTGARRRMGVLLLGSTRAERALAEVPLPALSVGWSGGPAPNDLRATIIAGLPSLRTFAQASLQALERQAAGQDALRRQQADRARLALARALEPVIALTERTVLAGSDYSRAFYLERIALMRAIRLLMTLEPARLEAARAELVRIADALAAELPPGNARLDAYERTIPRGARPTPDTAFVPVARDTLRMAGEMADAIREIARGLTAADAGFEPALARLQPAIAVQMRIDARVLEFVSAAPVSQPASAPR